jgi:hypothetical protein
MAEPTYRKALAAFAINLRKNGVSRDVFMLIKRDVKFTTMQYFDACLPTPQNRKALQPNGEIGKDCEISDKLTDINIISLMHLAIGILENARDAPADEIVQSDELEETPFDYTLRKLNAMMMLVYKQALRRNHQTTGHEMIVFITLGLKHAIFKWDIELILPWIETRYAEIYFHYIAKHTRFGQLPRNRRLSSTQLETLLEATIDNAEFSFLEFIYCWSTVFTATIVQGFWSLPSASQLFRLQNAPRGSPQRADLIRVTIENCFQHGAIVDITPQLFWDTIRQPPEQITDFGAVLAFQCLMFYYSKSEVNKAAIRTALEYFIQVRFVHSVYLLEFICVLAWECFSHITAWGIPAEFTFIQQHVSERVALRFDAAHRLTWLQLSDFFQDTPDATKEEWAKLATFYIDM